MPTLPWNQRPTPILLLACATFFLRFLAAATFFPYAMLWLAHNGHSTTSAAVILTLSRGFGFIAPPLLGGVADALKCHRGVFLAGSLINAVAVASLTIFPSSALWQALMLSIASSSDSMSLVDAIVVRSLAWAGFRHYAPRSRACGAVSWCAAGPLVGIIAKRYGIGLLFQLYPLLVLLSLPATALLPTRQAYAEEKQQAAAPSSESEPPATTKTTGDNTTAAAAPAAPAPLGSRRQRVFMVLQSPWTPTRLLLIFFCGIQFGIAFTYGFVFLEKELNASGVQLGLSLTSQALLEVPLFQVASPLIRKLGMVNALLTCQLAAAIRFLGYVSMPTCWWVLPFEVGHGWSFALMYTSLALLGEEFNHLGLQATVIGLANSCQQVGSLTAMLLWSGLISAVHLRSAFKIAVGLFAVVATPLIVTMARGACACIQRRRRRAALLEKAVERSDVDPDKEAAKAAPKLQESEMEMVRQ